MNALNHQTFCYFIWWWLPIQQFNDDDDDDGTDELDFIAQNKKIFHDDEYSNILVWFGLFGLSTSYNNGAVLAAVMTWFKTALADY